MRNVIVFFMNKINCGKIDMSTKIFYCESCGTPLVRHDGILAINEYRIFCKKDACMREYFKKSFVNLHSNTGEIDYEDFQRELFYIIKLLKLLKPWDEIASCFYNILAFLDKFEPGDFT